MTGLTVFIQSLVIVGLLVVVIQQGRSIRHLAEATRLNTESIRNIHNRVARIENKVGP